MVASQPVTQTTVRLPIGQIMDKYNTLTHTYIVLDYVDLIYCTYRLLADKTMVDLSRVIRLHPHPRTPQRSSLEWRRQTDCTHATRKEIENVNCIILLLFSYFYFHSTAYSRVWIGEHLAMTD